MDSLQSYHYFQKDKVMKYWFMAFLSVFFPWLVLLIYDNPGGALVAIVMQATLFGWIPASMWALRLVREDNKLRKKKKKAKKKAKQEAEDDE